MKPSPSRSQLGQMVQQQCTPCRSEVFPPLPPFPRMCSTMEHAWLSRFPIREFKSSTWFLQKSFYRCVGIPVVFETILLNSHPSVTDFTLTLNTPEQPWTNTSSTSSWSILYKNSKDWKVVYCWFFLSSHIMGHVSASACVCFYKYKHVHHHNPRNCSD